MKHNITGVIYIEPNLTDPTLILVILHGSRTDLSGPMLISHTDPTPIQHRSQTDPTLIPHSSYSDPTQIPHSSNTDPTLIPHSLYSDPTQLPPNSFQSAGLAETGAPNRITSCTIPALFLRLARSWEVRLGVLHTIYIYIPGPERYQD